MGSVTFSPFHTAGWVSAGCVTFLVFSPLFSAGPQLGWIISTDDQTLPITSFTQSDIYLLKIAYKPPTDSSVAERVDRVPLVVYDKHGIRSTNIYELVITIKPKDTLAPIVTRNTGMIHVCLEVSV